MLFRDRRAGDAGVPLAISQPAHAWIAGQILRAWADDLDEALLLAAVAPTWTTVSALTPGASFGNASAYEEEKSVSARAMKSALPKDCEKTIRAIPTDIFAGGRAF